MAKLILQFKGAFIKEYEIDKPSIRIGRREGNDIKIDNLAVSGNHAKIQKVDNSYIIVDLKSTNGTFVNRKKVVQAKLRHKDEITIGKHTLIFEDETQAGLEEEHGEVTEPGETIFVPAEEETKGMGRVPTTEEIEKIATVSIIGETSGPSEIRLIKKLTIIGKRDDADIRLKGVFAPKTAAFINKKPSGYSIIPSEEKIHIKINGETISRQTELSDGDVIEIGSLKMVFSMP
jgi:pSer/pThr/pTyr-binding forkhead associated (FHA) protein